MAMLNLLILTWVICVNEAPINQHFTDEEISSLMQSPEHSSFAESEEENMSVK